MRSARTVKNGEDSPVISVKQSDSNTYGHEVHLLGDAGHVIARVVQPRGQTLSCGARAWVETLQPVAVAVRFVCA